MVVLHLWCFVKGGVRQRVYFCKTVAVTMWGSLFLLMVDPKDGGSCGVEFEYLCLHFVNYVAIQREEVVFLFTHY